MSAKFWRLDNQCISNTRVRKMQDYRGMLADSIFTAEECNEFYAKIPQKTTKRQVRNPLIRKESEQKNPSRLILALIDRSIYAMMTSHVKT